MPQSPTTHTHHFLSQCTHETCQQLNSGPPCFLKLHCHPRATLQPRTHCAYPGLPQVPASCALHSFCDPSASPHPWTHPVSRPPDCPLCPDLSWTSWATLDPFYPSKANPMECPGPILPHQALPGSSFPGQSRGRCVGGTYLLPVPMGHGEMESRLEPAKGHLFTPDSTHTGHSLGVSPWHRLCSPALKWSSSWSPRCSWCGRAEP